MYILCAFHMTSSAIIGKEWKMSLSPCVLRHIQVPPLTGEGERRETLERIQSRNFGVIHAHAGSNRKTNSITRKKHNIIYLFIFKWRQNSN